MTQLAAVVLLGGIFSTPSSVRSQAAGPEDELRADSLYDVARYGTQATSYDSRVHASLVVEDAFRGVLARWAAGSSTAPGELSDLLQRVVENQAGHAIDASILPELEPVVTRGGRPRPLIRETLPGLRCLAKIQDHTLERLHELAPETLLPLVYFYQRAFIDQMTVTPRLWLAAPTHARIFSTLDRYLAGAGGDGADLVAEMLVAVTYPFNDVSCYDTFVDARDRFLGILELVPRHSPARYWAAILEEQLGNYRQAVKHLEVLRSERPRDLEVGLRLAINRCRNGKLEASAGELEAIARGDGPRWMRQVAYQELGRFFEPADGERAIGYLREALGRFPDDAGLQLQLHYLLASIRGDFEDWTAAPAAFRDHDPGASPRLRYGTPSSEDVERLVERMADEIRSRLPSLAAALERLSAERQEPDQQIFPECRGALSW